jgi:tRNA (cmo5U34)-methyltransferase
MRDRVFDKPGRVAPFTFDQAVVRVFDDMVSRSVPFYDELQRMTGELAAAYYQAGTHVYDLGCSTGTTLVSLMRSIRDPGARFVGLDRSAGMLEKARAKAARHGRRRRVSLVLGDLDEPARLTLGRASVVTMNWTLQFVRPIHRQALLARIHQALVPGGALILSEKVLPEGRELDPLYTRLYYDMKRRHGYSEREIAQKREALENVLMPCTLGENEALLRKAGFETVDSVFRWYNWATFLAVKNGSRD